ncbi:MAG TPA: acyl-[ACP]--phospholipid O-acyltransferase [Stellaceae bacterium]|jgi:acyl-[acyl-carrier-protein]-phospholipid O-acyltransferase/long-chain-fatty-acid--[acyl-carrier-protein] ligase|nr:acyl-[ACP]--phospholipid O-acyltransferase [Stellaceae bacterium]
MQSSQFALLQARRFLPLFVTQFLGALNDNFFKNALVILVTYRLAEEAGLNGQILVTAAAGLFILPFFLFSATSGLLADKVEKRRLILAVKTAEIVFMAIAVAGFYSGHVILLMTVLFLMGVHSTFFGPIKYGILPAHLAPGELLAGNALIEAGTFLAILIGTIVGGVIILTAHGIAVVSLGLLAVAVAGLVAAYFIPPAPPPAPDLALRFNIVADTFDMLRYARQRRELFLAMLGISWFWLVGATFLSQFPTLAKDVIGADENVVTLFLTAFTIGIALGSLICNRLLAGEVSTRLVPLAALGISLFTIDLYYASAALPPAGALLGIAGFLSHLAGWRIVGDLVLIAMSGGIFIVPLYAFLQAHSEESHRSRVIAANNIWNALFMVAAAIATIVLLETGFSVPQVFLIVAIVNFGVALWICRLLPGTVIKSLAAALFRLAYRVEVKGAENYRHAGKRAVVVVNHVSFLDGPLLAAFLPGRPIFPIDSFVAQRWWARPIFWLVDAVRINPTNPMATKALIRAVQADRKCVIFPEGRITITGALMKIYEGPGMIADKADAPLLPVRIDGAQYTPFSRLRGKLRLRLFPHITITILEPRRIAIDETLRGRKRRQAIGLQLYDIMTDLIFETNETRQTLFEAVLDARHVYGRHRPVVEDIERRPLTYDRLIAGSFALGRRLAVLAPPRGRIGVLLPNSAGLAVTFFALQAMGRVPALLNFSTGTATMLASCEAAQLTTVLTSRRFVAAAKLEETVAKLAATMAIVYLEDIRDTLRTADRLRGLVAARFAYRRYRRSGGGAAPHDPAVVLFTSGSEGAPKGVVLSHANILANRQQIGAVVDFNPSDTVFNALPLFHAFGLTGGLLLPALAGVKTFLYPTPLHYRIVAELIYDTNATIMFGTDTFLTGYARVANPYDFFSIRYVFAGAERVRAETRQAWSEKFGLRILEGYGATETAPVIAINTPMHYRAGTVGRLLPGIRSRLEPVPGIAEGGRLVIAGPNVMLGYLRVTAPGTLEKPEDGWYDTGDIVSFDGEGFITIHGRAKRFAKVAGEMISLALVEEQAERLWPDSHHAVIARPDPRRGEQLVLVTDRQDAARDALLAAARNSGLGELLVPKAILVVAKVPLLATGKVDYPAVQTLAEAEVVG